jgi:hypothetical protein
MNIHAAKMVEAAGQVAFRTPESSKLIATNVSR